MLFYRTVTQSTLELLIRIQNLLGENFLLVGGTALALLKGHRESIDIDLFSLIKFDPDLVILNLLEIGQLELNSKGENSLLCTLDGIKVDIIRHNYDLLMDPIHDEGLRIASLRDIGAMKLNAIVNRGTKKDFIDLYFLLKERSIQELIGDYMTKYKVDTSMMIRKSIVFFDDADVEPTPKMFEKLNWSDVKTFITEQALSLD